MKRVARVLIPVVFAAALPRSMAAQQAAAPTPAATTPNDSAATYRSAALSIAPRWDGLAVVRGANRQLVTNLHFFWPRDITPELRGTDTTAIGLDSLTRHAQRAVALRRAGAGFTDLGVLTMAVAMVRSLRDGRFATRDQQLAAAAVGALVVSVPLQFAADGELSRAVWWHNIRFAR
ncbi:MAG TPA: hypothetical protein VJW73_14910 [Gemmatimonadaceae bacterium]|nr:hypothetical protein [Gemmatimonadaceae bacterium]